VPVAEGRRIGAYSSTVAEVNLFGDEWEGGRDRPGWQWKRLPVGKRLGAEQIGAGLYELAPGQKTFPYHFHYAQEEWLIVLRGEPTLRDPSGERRLAAGDCVLFKCGPDGAHLVRNDTDEPARLLILSSSADVEIAVYPDSEKIGVFAEGLRALFRQGSEVDYFEGEE
jgi:uncharacterized cupin superfamily protein